MAALEEILLATSLSRSKPCESSSSGTFARTSCRASSIVRRAFAHPRDQRRDVTVGEGAFSERHLRHAGVRATHGLNQMTRRGLPWLDQPATIAARERALANQRGELPHSVTDLARACGKDRRHIPRVGHRRQVGRAERIRARCGVRRRRATVAAAGVWKRDDQAAASSGIFEPSASSAGTGRQPEDEKDDEREDSSHPRRLPRPTIEATRPSKRVSHLDEE